MILLAKLPSSKLQWAVTLASLILLSCSSRSWDARLVGTWVEDKERDEWGGSTIFCVYPDHGLTYLLGATCGTGWPKSGELMVRDDLLNFRIEGWAGSDDQYRFEFTGDRLILFGPHSRSAFYRDSLVLGI